VLGLIENAEPHQPEQEQNMDWMLVLAIVAAIFLWNAFDLNRFVPKLGA
jgi:hypothetical protein